MATLKEQFKSAPAYWQVQFIKDWGVIGFGLEVTLFPSNRSAHLTCGPFSFTVSRVYHSKPWTDNPKGFFPNSISWKSGS